MKKKERTEKRGIPTLLLGFLVIVSLFILMVVPAAIKSWWFRRQPDLILYNGSHWSSWLWVLPLLVPLVFWLGRGRLFAEFLAKLQKRSKQLIAALLVLVSLVLGIGGFFARKEITTTEVRAYGLFGYEERRYALSEATEAKLDLRWESTGKRSRSCKLYYEIVFPDGERIAFTGKIDTLLKIDGQLQDIPKTVENGDLVDRLSCSKEERERVRAVIEAYTDG